MPLSCALAYKHRSTVCCQMLTTCLSLVDLWALSMSSSDFDRDDFIVPPAPAVKSLPPGGDQIRP